MKTAVKIHKQTGFSLVEILIVIAIAAILAMMSVYSWDRYVNNANLRTAARQLESDIKTMKERAYAAGTTLTMVFSKTAAPNTYTRYNGIATETVSLESFGKGITIYTLPGAGTSYTLSFLARGILSPAPTAITNCSTINNTCWIVFRNSRSSQATITFNPLTGKTYVAFAMQ
jgi:prepilin-type N-terminal cleavage/methylation domain-containing protein